MKSVEESKEIEFFELNKYTPEEEQPVEHIQMFQKKRQVNEQELNNEQRRIYEFMSNNPFEDTPQPPDVDLNMLQNLGNATSKSKSSDKKWRITYENGTEYEGNIVENKSSKDFEQPILFGNFIFPNGDKYEGSVGKRAEGTYTHQNGVKYKGQFYKLAKSGNGIQSFPSGTIYEGMFKENMYHGKGNINFLNGDNYNGTFNNGKRNHIGKYSYPSGETVIGDWQNDMLHGNARYQFTNGKKIISAFENNAIKL